MDWVRSVSELAHGEVVAIDGKTLRRCHDRANGRGPLHMVSAWATEHRMVLGQTRTEAHSKKARSAATTPASGAITRCWPSLPAPTTY